MDDGSTRVRGRLEGLRRAFSGPRSGQGASADIESALIWCAFVPVIQLTKRTEYGLIALVHMAEREGHCVSAREISERFLIPKRLLAEVLKDLCHADLIDSHRGATGGYS